MSFCASDPIPTPTFPLSIISLLTYRNYWSHTHAHTNTNSNTNTNPQKEGARVQVADVEICLLLLFDPDSRINLEISKYLIE